MKQSVLMCDLCTEPRFAVATLDLCSSHKGKIKEIKRTFGTKINKSRRPHPNIETEVLAVLTTKPARATEIADKIGVHVTTVYNALHSLTKAGKVKHEGASRSSRYRKA